MFDLVPALNISSSGLVAERTRMEVAANNLANAHSVAGKDGNIYKRKLPIFEAVLKDTMSSNPKDALGGVKVVDIIDDNRPDTEIYAPYNPNANNNGMIKTANIAPMEEMLDIITATRAYEANLSAMQQSKNMALKTITLGKNV
jgi:flagellar basal-body rod protein FlgC